MVTLGFLAGGGDSYPFPRFKTEDTTRFNLVSLDTTPENQGFSDEGREQKVLADYLAAMYPASGPGFTQADTAKVADTRIRSVGP